MLTLITINYNGARRTIELLRSLERQTEKQFDVLVVDNDSSADDRALLAEYAATSPLTVELLFSETNRGFSGGNNLAIRKALQQGREWIVCINNDTTVDSSFIEMLSQRLRDQQPALIGLAIQEEERVFAGKMQWLRTTLPHSASASDHNLYAIGAGMVIHREVFERVGFLDEAYFLYFEDADFSARARRAGIPVTFFHDIVVRHHVSQSTKKLGSNLLLRYHMRNAIRFNWRNGPWWVRIFLPVWIGFLALKQIVKLVAGRHRPATRAILAGIRDALQGRWGHIDTRTLIAIECESVEGDSWGVARVTRQLVLHLAGRENVQRHYRIRLYGKGTVPDFFSSLDPGVFSFHFFGVSSFSLYYYLLLPFRLWWDRPAVIYYPNYMLPILHPPGVASLVLLTEDVFREANNPRLPLRYRVAYKLFATGWARMRATRILAISHASRDALVQEGISKERILVNPLAVDTPLAVHLHAQRPYFLYVAQAFPRRHLRETLEAFEKIAKKNDGIDFHIIGPDKYEPPFLEKEVAAVNKRLHRSAVVWRERVDEQALAEAYAGATALIYVSDAEAFGLPPLEALSYGTPAIVKDAPVHRELFGLYAFYVPDGTSASIQKGMEAALRDRGQREQILEAKDDLLSRYTWQAHADRFLDIVTQMCSNRSS